MKSHICLGSAGHGQRGIFSVTQETRCETGKWDTGREERGSGHCGRNCTLGPRETHAGPVYQYFTEALGEARESEGVVQVSDTVLGQPGCVDGLRDGQTGRGINDFDKDVRGDR